jgi:hypothetical protein
MKILPCNRCQHYIHNEREPSAFSQCGHPDTQKIDFVTGQTTPMFCVTVRSLSTKCGHEGKLWAYDDAFPPVQEWEA